VEPLFAHHALMPQPMPLTLDLEQDPLQIVHGVAILVFLQAMDHAASVQQEHTQTPVEPLFACLVALVHIPLYKVLPRVLPVQQEHTQTPVEPLFAHHALMPQPMPLTLDLEQDPLQIVRGDAILVFLQAMDHAASVQQEHTQTPVEPLFACLVA